MKSLKVLCSLGHPLACLSWFVSLLAALPGCSPAANAESSASTSSALRTGPPGTAQWSATIPLTVIPVAGANLTDGRVLFWSSNGRLSYGGSGQTYTTLFDPASKTATELLVTATGHDMFCPGTANLADGRILVSGGEDSGKTSLFDPSTGSWSTGPLMSVARGYEADAPVWDGSILTLGGSWSGGRGNKNGEIWTASGGWRALPGVLAAPALTADPAGIFRSDNHMWLISTGTGRLLQAGPSRQMNWIDTAGSGSIVSAGNRGDDVDSMCGNAVMYDVGKILKVGGSISYDSGDANANAYVIDVTRGLSVRKVAPMTYVRSFHNSVVLPNGQVVVIGGMTRPATFSDGNAVLVPELWDPSTETFTVLPAMTTPRNYHSIALLLPDGTVVSGGGGLCGTCAANHPDVQILTPPYLLNQDGTPAQRPTILSAPSVLAYGSSAAVTTAQPVSAFALLRLSSTTHTVNNDQRRIPLAFQSTGTNSYALTIPTNPGIALPGAYMLFALDASGVPSVARTVLLDPSATPVLAPPGDHTLQVDVASSIELLAVAPGGPSSIVFGAQGLPPGLAIDPATGIVSGAPTTAGTYAGSLSAANAAGGVSFDLTWTVTTGSTTGFRYVRLVELTEVNGKAWGSMAEFNVLDANAHPLPRAGWVVTADGFNPGNEAAKAIDGDPSTFWHTQWQGANPPPPHSFTVDLGAPQSITGFQYLPRQDGNQNGTVAQYQFFVSSDGVAWGNPVAQGDFTTMGATSALKVVKVTPRVTLVTPPAQSTMIGQAVSLAIAASDSGGLALTYTAQGLPPGVTIAPGTGVISGTTTTSGTYAVTVQAQDASGGSAPATFKWTVTTGSTTGFRYVRLVELTEVNGKAWGSMAEFNVLDANAHPLPRAGWVVTADGFNPGNEAAKAIDGDPSTFWHTQWHGANPPPPHSFTVDLGAPQSITGFQYLPRQDGNQNGTVAQYQFFVSSDGVTWGNPVAQGDFTTMGATSALKVVTFPAVL